MFAVYPFFNVTGTRECYSMWPLKWFYCKGPNKNVSWWLQNQIQSYWLHELNGTQWPSPKETSKCHFKGDIKSTCNCFFNALHYILFFILLAFIRRCTYAALKLLVCERDEGFVHIILTYSVHNTVCWYLKALVAITDGLSNSRRAACHHNVPYISWGFKYLIRFFFEVGTHIYYKGYDSPPEN